MKLRAPLMSLLLLSSLLSAGPAASEPSVWSVVQNPVLASNEALYRQVEGRLAQLRLPATSKPFSKLLGAAKRWKRLREALQLLETGNASQSGDARLLHQLAQIHHQLYLADKDQAQLREAIPLYRQTIRLSKIASRRAEAYNDLAICYARLEQHGPEIEAYHQALLSEPHAETRAILLANQAEGFMVQGELTKAVRGYRKSLRITPSSVMHRLSVTTLWGLAAALDRTGDLPAALEQIRLARSYDPGDRAINGPNWFYVPPYDVHWYAALGHWARARHTPNRAERLQSYRQAIAAWKAYLDQASRTDRWLSLAGTRLQQCDDERRTLLGQSSP